MDTNIAFQERGVISEVKYLPAVTIIMPFHPVITKKSEIECRVKLMTGKIEQELLTHYPAEKAVPVIIKLKALIRNLNFNVHTKSIAIFVSPVAEKVYYLDADVDEQIVCDEAFQLRDLVRNKKNKKEYIVMTLGYEYSKTYVGNTSAFTLIKSNVVKSRIAADSNTSGDFFLDEFLRKLDKGLSIIIKSYPLPVFIIGNKKLLTQFKNATINEKSIVHFIENNYNYVQEQDIQIDLKPYELEWEKVKQKYLLSQVEKAKCENKLALGIVEVWQKAKQKKVKLLVLETKYKIPETINWHDSFSKMEYPGANPFYIKNEVDEIIDLVLERCGDVEYVEENILNDYGHIALVAG